MQAFYQ